MDLSEIRIQIDEIDSQLFSLLEKRMHLSTEVARYKKGKGLPVTDKKREQDILNKAEIYENSCAIKEVFKSIIKESCVLQTDILSQD